MSKTIEVTLDDHCNNVIQTELDSGEYEGVNDVIHGDLIILEKETNGKA
jgi:Arc/MetJ-type ribon-helix-helix transcriptional regulator